MPSRATQPMRLSATAAAAAVFVFSVQVHAQQPASTSEADGKEGAGQVASDVKAKAKAKAGVSTSKSKALEAPRPILLAQANTPAAPSAASAPAPQQVTVTGIRKGIEDAISVKKNADSIVEAVSAEDIGKLPDASVAESLSRLPGVTVQRSAVTGRAQGVSVRGMSPDFSAGLLNGREVASTAVGRGVEFDQYPAELLGQLVVYKTPDAALVGQGLSGTINQLTVRPLDFATRTIAAGLRYEYNGKADSGAAFGSGHGNRLSLSYIDQFDDRKLGVALGLARYDAKGGGRPRSGWGGSVQYDITNNRFAGWDGSGCTAGVDCVKAPQGIQFDTEKINSQRTGAVAVLQYKPNKDFETMLDVFYSKGDFSLKKRGIEGPVGALSAGANDSGGQLLPGYTIGGTGADRYIASGTLTNFRGVIRAHNEDYVDDLLALGWNTKMRFGAWTVAGDVGTSSVKKNATRFETTLGLPGSTNNPNDTISWTGFTGNNTDSTRFTTGVNYADPSVIRLTNPQGWGGDLGQDGYYANPVTKDSVNSLRLSAKRDLGFAALTDVDFGVNLADRKKTRSTREGSLGLGGGTGATPPGSFFNAAVPNPGSSTAGTSGIPIVTWEPAGSLGSVYTLRNWTDADILTKSWGVQEKVTTAFVKSNIDTKVGGMDVRGNVGLQLVNTKQTSSGNNIDPSTCGVTPNTCAVRPFSLGTSYSDVLPSLNLAALLGGDRVLRLGLGRQMMRPNMEDLSATINASYNTTQNRIEGSSGNPYLKPFRANAIDLSFEQYWGTKAYVSGAIFYKDLSSYILRTSETVDVRRYLPQDYVLPAGSSVTGLLNSPRNGSGGSIRGIEAALNMPFGGGFGALLNYSYTDSSVKIPTSGISQTGIGGQTIPLPGLSKQVVNLRVYYEQGGFQIALAGRNRSAFVGSIADYQDKNQLVWFKPETQLDLQAAYTIGYGPAKGLSILAQANNLTNTEQVRFNEVTGDVTERKKFGAQYLFGLNYKF